MRALLPLVLVLALVGGESPPVAWLPADAPLVLQVPDVAASTRRWAETPYPRLLDSGWGRILLAEWGARLEAACPGARAALGGLTALAAAARLEPPRWLAVAARLGEAAPALAAALAPQLPEGRVTGEAGLLAWWAEGEPRAARAPLAVPQAPPADAELDGQLPDGSRIRVSWQLDALGVREVWRVPPTPRARTAALRLAAADPAEFARLPASTLWACTWRLTPETLAALPAAEHWQAPLAAWLARHDLPELLATIAASRGPGLLWITEGVPFPAAHAALSLDAAQAQRWLDALQARLRLQRQGESVRGFIGMVPLTAGIAADGRFVVTTDPQGLAAWTAMRPGFTALPEIAAELATVPPRCVMIGVGRGGRAWAALAQVAVPLFVALGAPHAVSLPADLRASTDRDGWWLRLAEDGAWQGEGVGLAGGPLTTAASLAIGVHATRWLEAQLRREQRLPEAAPAPAEPQSF